ncbi:DUF6571 family protein [Streptomyces indicus]|uniref:AG2 protein n=1 Tax=Streptomyces indicus TaxID=417292 RepID=A0A1G8VTB7_9ACTN|nr:DUF6571 family protein [Streptomyces indicus]SDJ69067.1 hypothetical protein SAMN05421806_10214 [Streptomyces indicus]
MNFDDLRHANFSLLDDAVSDWSKMVDNLKDLEKDANDGLLKDSRKANWKGVSASVNREFVGKTAGEFGDAHTQAESIWKILQDTRDELKDYKKKLNDAVERAVGKKVSVTGTSGGGFKAQMNADPEPKDAKATVDAIVEEIQGILEKATESDSSAAKVLKALADLSKHGFSDAKYKDRDSAADALKDAERLAALAKKKPEDLTAKDFDALNKGFKDHAGDPLFSESFAGRLGAKGTLEFWAGINGHGVAYELRDKTDQFDELQKNLSLTLAAATQADTPEMREWTSNMTKLGNQQIGGIGGPHGFQVMSNLMRWGDYDDKFLNSYGNELIKMEKQLTDNGRHAPLAWEPTGPFTLLNRTGSDSGSDPMTGFMKALANSPAAATEFFGDTFVTKDEDHEFLRDTDDANTHKGKVGLTNFQYLFEERDWPQDYTDDGEKSVAGKNALGHALEAATTGHPPGAPSPDTVIHTRQQADLFEEIVKSVGRDQNRLLEHGYMSDSLGKITAEYMPDVHAALNPGENGDKTFTAQGERATLAESDTTKLLHALGRNPEGYAAVNLGQHNYTTNLLHYHAENPDAFLDGDRGLTASLTTGETAGEIQGIISSGRAYEAELQGGESDAKYNAALDSASTWGGALAGTGIGFLVAPTAGPGAIIAADVASTAVGEIISSITDGAKQDSTGEVLYQNGRAWDATHNDTYTLLEREAEKAGKASGDPNQHIPAKIADAAQAGFGNAQDNISKYIDGEGVPGKLEAKE